MGSKNSAVVNDIRLNSRVISVGFKNTAVKIDQKRCNSPGAKTKIDTQGVGPRKLIGEMP